MLRLQPPEPEWLGAIPSTDKKDKRPFLMKGVRMAFNPIDDEGFDAGQAAMLGELEATGDQLKALKLAQSELLRRGIADWEGLGDKDGNKLAVTPEAIERVIRDPRIRPHMVDAYVTPFLMWDAEGNASAG